tara:strand:+ start:539 stop:790 length:252 start_codon:yes stop_codon:yes gene_type:complete
MEFQIDAFRRRRVIERIEGTIKISKKEVMRVTGCPSSEDGDSTAWYSYVEEAIENGAYHRQDVKVTRQAQSDESEYTGVEIDW